MTDSFETQPPQVDTERRPVGLATKTTGNVPRHTVWFDTSYPTVGLDLMTDGTVRWRYKEVAP